MQTPEEKCQAIRSVLWLLVDHYRMVKMGRIGSCIHYERAPDGLERWHPPIIEEFEDWPVEHVCAWLARQRSISRRYRLWSVGLALQRLETQNPAQARAVWFRHVEIPPPNWYRNLDALAEEGIRFMAEDIPGDVPEWGGPRPRSRRAQIEAALEDGLTIKAVARRVGCSVRTVKRVKAELRERTLSAVSGQIGGHLI